jgi:hypothetical protein
MMALVPVRSGCADRARRVDIAVLWGRSVAEQRAMVALEDRRHGRRAGSGTPDGAFVFDRFVPDPTMFDWGQRVEALAVTEDSATLEV